jgi:hypothetical protein
LIICRIRAERTEAELDTARAEQQRVPFTPLTTNGSAAI